MKIPYWRWLCNSKNDSSKNYLVDYKALVHKWINGELLVGIIYRLKDSNINIDTFIEALEKTLLLYKENDEKINEELEELIEKGAYGVENIGKLIEINDFKVSCNDLEKFISLIKHCEEVEYPLLQELSEKVFNDLQKLYLKDYFDNEKYIETIEHLKDSILTIKNLLKENILDNQMSYFDEYTQENKKLIHLGYKVYCMEFMDRFINQELEFYTSNKKEYSDVNFPEKMYTYLLDWDGDVE